MPEHTHGVESSHERELKRLRITVRSHLQLALGLPLDPELANPFPLPPHIVRAHLQRVVNWGKSYDGVGHRSVDLAEADSLGGGERHASAGGEWF